MQNSAPSLIMMAVGTGISSIIGPLFEGESAVAAEGVTIDATAAEETASISGILRAAARGKGNFGVGTATATEAEAAGRAWVGEGAVVASDGKTLVSADEPRQYRPGTFKPKLGRTQANLEWRLKPEGKWQGNGHIDIVPK